MVPYLYPDLMIWEQNVDGHLPLLDIVQPLNIVPKEA